MWRPDPAPLAQTLSYHFGIPLEGRSLTVRGGYPALELRPLDCRPSEAFTVAIATDWRSLNLKFLPGSYAGELVAQMGNPEHGRTGLFQRMLELCEANRARVGIRVNGESADPAEPGLWQREWRHLEIELTKSPAVVNTEDTRANDAELLTWARRFVGLVFVLLPMEDVENSEGQPRESVPEGALIRVEVNRYERSRINRAACIELHGVRCKVCGLSFSERYGPAGSGLIHVHHITPVSRLGPGYIIDPLNDLVPLCPNCHAMAHRRDPPFEVEELTAMLHGGDR